MHIGKKMTKDVVVMLWYGVFTVIGIFLVFSIGNSVENTLNTSGFDTLSSLREILNVFFVEHIFTAVISFFIIYVLAVFRLIRLITYDTITKPVREWVSTKKENPFWASIDTMIQCPWCISIWISILLILIPLSFGFVGFFILTVLAVSALASFMILVTNLVGWNAQHRKQKVLKQ